VIVGSAIVRRIEESRDHPGMVERVGQYVASMKTAVAGSASTLGVG
jgi:tryptophan synthase alpha subunit